MGRNGAERCRPCQYQGHVEVSEPATTFAGLLHTIADCTFHTSCRYDAHGEFEEEDAEVAFISRGAASCLLRDKREINHTASAPSCLVMGRCCWQHGLDAESVAAAMQTC